MTVPDVDSGVLETVLPCDDLDAMTEFVRLELDGRVLSISPADDPREVLVDVAGGRLRLRRDDRPDHGTRLVVRTATDRPAVTAPNGTVVEFRSSSSEPLLPESQPSLSIVRAGESFGVGRAGMGYRDLLPDRWGGRFIASHIRISDGGDVPDYVHFHRIRFQMIFCARGWVDLVYEDQGEPFRLEAGDCVLQPPGIRHRVLRSSPGLEVIEVGCPAVHDTLVDHEIELPTSVVDPARDFGGQRFVRHVASEATRTPWLVDGLVVRDTGIGHATGGLAGAVVVEAVAASTVAASTVAESTADAAELLTHGGEFCMYVVLHGEADLGVDGGRPHRVGARDAVALPAGTQWTWASWSADFAVLQVTLPGTAVRTAIR